VVARGAFARVPADEEEPEPKRLRRVRLATHDV
jgi:hypothetical protein